MTSGFVAKSWMSAVSLDEAQALDAICDEFESEWKESRYPSIEQYLTRVDESLRTYLLTELVNVDATYRSQLGDTASPQDYITRFPELREVLISTAGDQPTVVVEKDVPANLAPTELLPADAVVETLGDHQLMEAIGEGSFGTVWRAWNPKLQRTDAIKLPKHRLQTRSQIDAFLHEARAAAKLEHPNIVRVYGYGEHEKRGYIVFEFIAGVTLTELRQTRPPEIREAADICRQLADALAHAHDNDIVHRDIKSSNVMIDFTGRPRLTDFGLARRMDIASTIAHGGAILGTFPYMSPEQVTGKQKVDAKSDIYSLGIVLYELLTGTVPFRGDRSSIVNEILTKTPDPPRHTNKAVPKDLETICLKAIARVKSDRYATAAEFRDDLQRFLNGEPVSARRLSVAARFTRYIRRNPTLAAGYGGTIMCAGVAAAVWMNQDVNGIPDPIRDQLLKQGQEAIQLSKEADPTGLWTVAVNTTPPGAKLHFIPRDTDTGEPVPHRDFEAKGTTPLKIDLRPGRYIVTAALPGTGRFQEVERLVPHSKMFLPIGTGKQMLWKRTADSAMEWLPIDIPEESVTDDMILIRGTPEFKTSDPDDPDSVETVVRVPDFYISKTELTAGDFLRIKPGAEKRKSFINKGLQPEQPYDMAFCDALDFAESAGCRLLTNIEFDYLAQQISLPDSPLASPATGMLQHRDWDVLPTAPDVKGLLTGLPEWVSAPIYFSLDQYRGSLPLELNEKAVMRGLPMNATEEELKLGALSPFTRAVVPADLRDGSMQVGFRLVRSARPVGATD